MLDFTSCCPIAIKTKTTFHEVEDGTLSYLYMMPHAVCDVFLKVTADVKSLHLQCIFVTPRCLTISPAH